MLSIKSLFRIPGILFFSLLFSSNGFAQLASEPFYDFEFANIYAELFPEKNEADVIAVLYLNGNGSDPVFLRCEGNFKRFHVSSAGQSNLAFNYRPPFFLLYNIASGSQEIRFVYRVKHDGTSSSGSIISSDRIDLGVTSFWYPRNNASDPHQVVLNLVTDPSYSISANASLTRDIPNNLKRLRTFILRDAIPQGLTLSGGK